MKKIISMMAMLLVLVAMTQCKKPTIPLYNGKVVYVNKEITITTGSNAKVDPEDVINKIKFKWESSDVIHVYSYANEQKKYCGKLSLIEGADTETGSFKGNVDIPTDGNETPIGQLRFLYCNQVGSDGSVSIDFSTQEGTLQSIASRLLAYSDYVETKGVVEGTVSSIVLKLPYTIVKFDKSKIGGGSKGNGNVTMRGMIDKGVSIDKDGTQTILKQKPSTPVTITVSKDTKDGEEYAYVMVMPENVKQLYFYQATGNFGYYDFPGTGDDSCLHKNRLATLPLKSGTGNKSVTPKTNKVCDCGVFNVGGAVKSSEEQRCVYGLIYGLVEDLGGNSPTLDNSGCEYTEYFGPVGVDSLYFNEDLDGLIIGENYAFQTYVIGENGVTVYGDIKYWVWQGKPLPQPKNDNEYYVAPTHKELGNYLYSAENVEGVIPFVFKFNDGNANVRYFFSKGNLQYIGDPNSDYYKNEGNIEHWRFADHQFDFFAFTRGRNTEDEKVAEDRDLFSWGTSGQPHTIAYQPWYYGGDANRFWAYGQRHNGLHSVTTYKADWGYNDIYNAAHEKALMWYVPEGYCRNVYGSTVKGYGDWYLLMQSVITQNHCCRGKIGECTDGTILLPDGWDWDVVKDTVKDQKGYFDSAYSLDNVLHLNYSQWSCFEHYGAVFIPDANAYGVVGVEVRSYWSSSAFASNENQTGELSYHLILYKGGDDNSMGIEKSRRLPVRLVYNYKGTNNKTGVVERRFEPTN